MSFMHEIRLSSNKDVLTSSLPICINFVYLTFIVLAKTSNMILNINRESGHTCLVPEFSGNAL